ncbi:MAG TPA: protein kinase [Ktedonobacteraceae bacterium]
MGKILRTRYELIDRIGGGGMANVYRAKDRHFGERFVAVKEMRQDHLKSPKELDNAAKNFEQEALLLEKLRHQNLPHVRDFFMEDGKWYLVMDFITGTTLEEYQAMRGGKLPVGEVLQIGIQLCDVLHYLHTQLPRPIVFRDLKPTNIMRTIDRGQIYLIDFGIARFFTPGQTSDTSPFRTPGYAPPEQAGYLHEQTTPRSDIYSLGATLHHLLSGHFPYDNQPTLFSFPPLQSFNPSIPAELAASITQMIQLEPAERPADVRSIQAIFVHLANQPAAGLPLVLPPLSNNAMPGNSSTYGNPLPNNAMPGNSSTYGSPPHNSTTLEIQPPPLPVQLQAPLPASGRPGWIERRVFLALAGLATLGIGLGIYIGGQGHKSKTASPQPGATPTPRQLVSAWSKSQPLGPSAPASGISPALVAQDKLNAPLYAAFVNTNTGNGLLMVSSTDGGAHWGLELDINQYSSTTPSLIYWAQQKRYFMAFVTNDFFQNLVITSSTDARIWNPIQTTSQSTQASPAMAVSQADGALYIAFVAKDGSNGLLTISSTDGVNWSGMKPVGISTTTPPALTYFNGALFLAYVDTSQDNALLIMSSMNGGNTWSGSQHVGYSSSAAPALLVLNNILYMVFVANDISHNIEVVFSHDGVNWMSKPQVGAKSTMTPALASWNHALTMVFVEPDNSNKLLFTSSN